MEIKRYMLPVVKQMNHRGEMYSVGNIVNNYEKKILDLQQDRSHLPFACFFFFNSHSFFIFFIFGCVGSSLLSVGFLQLRRAGATLHCSVQASHCGGFSCCRAWALGARASVAVARSFSSCGSWALEHRLSSCGSWAQLLHGMWDLPGPGLKPMSPALAGRFLTTVPPGKPCLLLNGANS